MAHAHTHIYILKGEFVCIMEEAVAKLELFYFRAMHPFIKGSSEDVPFYANKHNQIINIVVCSMTIL